MRNEAFINIEHLAEVATPDEYGEVSVNQEDLLEVWMHLCKLHSVVTEAKEYASKARRLVVSCNLVLNKSK